MNITNDKAAENFKGETNAAASIKEKKSTSVRGTGKEITVYAVPDIKTLADKANVNINAMPSPQRKTAFMCST